MDINCPHCGKSLKAPPSAAGKLATCKKCGGRFNVPAPTAKLAISESPLEKPPSTGKVHVITEQTSKRYKLLQIVGAMISVIACVFLFASYNSAVSSAVDNSKSNANTWAGVSMLGIMVGIGIFIYGRFMAWWHHG